MAEASDDGTRVWRLRWSRVTAAIAFGIGAGILLLGAAARLYLVHFRGLEAVAYTDALTPSGWQRIRTEIGNRAIAEADAALRRSEIDTALRLYRVGLAKAPRNANARIALAKLYVGGLISRATCFQAVCPPSRKIRNISS